MRQSLTFLIGLVALSACSEIPPQAFANRGGPESLLNASSERVHVSLSTPGAIQELSKWIGQDQPTRAELDCAEGSPLCQQASETLAQFGVPADRVGGGNNRVALIYERVTAKDCDPRFITNHINPYNLPHPSFGCSTAANMVMMVSDKQQFTNPGLLDYFDAERANQVFDIYVASPPRNDTMESILQGATEN